jgi:hypothetical protein
MGSVGSDEQRPARGVILVSGFVFPGLGQFLQRRWLAGALFAGVFSLCFGLLLVRCFQSIATFYKVGLDALSPDEPPPVASIVGLFGLCLLVHLTNIFDVYRAHRRAARRSAVKRHLHPLVTAVLNEEEGDKEA